MAGSRAPAAKPPLPPSTPVSQTGLHHAPRPRSAVLPARREALPEEETLAQLLKRKRSIANQTRSRRRRQREPIATNARHGHSPASTTRPGRARGWAHRLRRQPHRRDQQGHAGSDAGGERRFRMSASLRPPTRAERSRIELDRMRYRSRCRLGSLPTAGRLGSQAGVPC